MGQRLRDVSEGSIFQRGQSLDGFDLAQAVARGGRIPFSSLPMPADTSHRVVLNILAVANAQLYIDAGFGNFTSLQTNIPGGAQVGDILCATNGTITFEFVWAGSAFGAILGDIVDNSITPDGTDITTADGTWSVIRRGGEVTVASGIEFLSEEITFEGLESGATTTILGLEPLTNQLIRTTVVGGGDGSLTVDGVTGVHTIEEGNGLRLDQTLVRNVPTAGSVTARADVRISHIGLNPSAGSTFQTGGDNQIDIFKSSQAAQRFDGTYGLSYFTPSTYIIPDDQHNGTGAMIVNSPFLKLYETGTTDEDFTDNARASYNLESRGTVAQGFSPVQTINLGVQALRFDGDDFNITQTLDGTDPVIGDYTITSNVGGLAKHVHDQSAAAATWNITHPLAEQFPVVTVYDNSTPPQVVLPMEIQANSTTSMTITFPTAVAGRATLIG